MADIDVESKRLARLTEGAEPASRVRDGSPTTELALAGLVLIALAARGFLVFRMNVNWDEFYFLSLVHDYLRGTLPLPFQTFHVHLFAWLPDIAGDEMAEILAARLAMTLLGIASAALIYGIGRRFLTRAGALFGLLAYLSFGYVIEHGASFRADPLLTVLGLTAIFAILRRPGGAAGAVLAGAAGAVGLLFSIKIALLLALVGAVYLCLIIASANRWRAMVEPAVFLVTLAVCFVPLFLLHRGTLSVEETGATAFLTGAAAKTLTGQGLAKMLNYALLSALRNPAIWLMLLGGFAIALREAACCRTRAVGEKLIPVVLSFLLPTLLLYRNAFPYYYAFALAPAAPLAGLFYDRLTSPVRKSLHRGPLLPASLILMLGATLALNVQRASPDFQAAQRQLLRIVHETFREPVLYMDGYGMVGSFPRASFFMSSWGMENYVAAGRPFFSGAVLDAPPLLVVANSPELADALLPERAIAAPRIALLDADIRYLRENYRPYWGVIFLPGRQIADDAAEEDRRFPIAVAGSYRLTAAAAVILDGRSVAPGAVISLERGSHRLDGPLPPGGVALDWAAVPPAPSEQPIDLKPFTSFVRAR